MEPTGPYRPHISRETRLLLTAGVTAIAVLWILARVRFQDLPVTPNPVPAVLGQFDNRLKYDEHTAELLRLRGRIDAALTTIELPPAGDSAAASARRITALRLPNEVAISWVHPSIPIASGRWDVRVARLTSGERLNVRARRRKELHDVVLVGAPILAIPDNEALGLIMSVELEASRVRLGGRTTTVVSVPIGVDYDRIQAFAATPDLLAEQERLKTILGLRANIIGLGVDRLDYTKGIPERLDALDELLSRRSDLRSRLTFVQIGVPSRSDLDSYAPIEAAIGARIEQINKRHTQPGGVPSVVYHTTLGAFSLVALYRLAHFCIVSFSVAR